jgi:hypothetical protein
MISRSCFVHVCPPFDYWFTGESNTCTTRVLSSIRQPSTTTITCTNHEHTRPNKDAANAHDASTYHQDSNNGHAINYATNKEAIF